MKSTHLVILWTTLLIDLTKQECPMEVFDKKHRVVWHQSLRAKNVKSYPQCFSGNNLITRNCNGTHWLPPLVQLPPCFKVGASFDLASCPPGYHRILGNGNDYCYQIGKPYAWNYPCFNTGGATAITDLDEAELEYLLSSLNSTSTTKYFWLPGQRAKILHPLVWHLPGPSWGSRVESKNSLKIQPLFFKNCMLLDVEQRIIKTDTCNKIYPSLCFFINEFQYPVTCPEGYHAFRFMPNERSCYGIEQSSNPLSLTEFTQTKCEKPMNKFDDLKIFIFKNIADLRELPKSEKCWFQLNENSSATNNALDSGTINNFSLVLQNFEGVINSNGEVGFLNTMEKLSCIACEKEILNTETSLQFEYDEILDVLYLTVYSPSGLWKYDETDIGIRCFSNANGFFNSVEICELPLIVVNRRTNYTETELLEKFVYVIKRITNRSAEYWCEGHLTDLSLISTEKVIVGAQEDDEHVFALVLGLHFIVSEINQTDPHVMNRVEMIENDISIIFNANKVIVMDVLNNTRESLLVLVHLHVTIPEINSEKSQNIVTKIHELEKNAETEFSKSNDNYTFVNISSSVYCLPDKTVGENVLNWDLTPIGHMAAPNEFCLQENGLPVKRHCYGSFLLGGIWGEVQGSCNKNYEATNTTTFLYNFVKNQMPNNSTTTFLTKGLNYVLSDIDIIIPADIYYLSMSLMHVLDLVKLDQSAVDMGDIDNMAWVMDRVLTLNNQYLRLAQTLNSTNVILDCANDIFELIAYNNSNLVNTIKNDTRYFQLSVKPQFIVQISYPKFNNITGVAVIKKAESSDKFTEMIIQPLYKNTTLEEVTSIENLELATWIPASLLNTLRKSLNESKDEDIDDNEVYIVVNIFYNDAIFQEIDFNEHLVNSRIVGISIPGFVSNLEDALPLVFRDLNYFNKKSFCGYWDFQPHLSDLLGFWTTKGCYMVEHYNNLSICECYHLTHFGQLINLAGNDNENNSMTPQHKQALNMITVIGSSLSLVGIFGIWVTAIVFYAWRRKAGTKVLLHLSASIALPLVFILFFNIADSFSDGNNVDNLTTRRSRVTCVVLGALLHYSVLSSFTWMLISAILQFIRYVRVLGIRWPSRFMIKLTVIGWGVPVIPIVPVLIIGPENYIPDKTSEMPTICYPSDSYFLFSLVVPICLILVINIALFLCVIYAISKGPEGKMRSSDTDQVSAQLRLSILLFFLLGFTWIFGIMSFSKNLLWSYLFCITSTLQGFILFIYFVICDPGTRSLWVTLMTPQFKKSSSRTSIISISTN